MRPICTIGDLIDNGFRLNLYCQTCLRGGQVDMAAVVRKFGRDATYLKPDSPLRFKCSTCRNVSREYQIAPLPERGMLNV